MSGHADAEALVVAAEATGVATARVERTRLTELALVDLRLLQRSPKELLQPSTALPSAGCADALRLTVSGNAEWMPQCNGSIKNYEKNYWRHHTYLAAFTGHHAEMNAVGDVCADAAQLLTFTCFHHFRFLCNYAKVDAYFI